MKKLYKVGIYCRLSVDDASNSAKAKNYIPADESVSIENQYELLSKFVMLNGWTEVKSYRDDGYSGGNFQRPGFLEMLEDARHGLINLILVKDLSRLGRDFVEVGRYTDVIFPSLGCRFVSVLDCLDTEGDNTDMLHFRSLMNDYHLKDLSGKIKSVLHAKMRSDQYIAAYGVVETTYTEADESYAAKRRSQKSGVRTRQLPGVSPLVFSRFLLEKTAFLSLSDMGKALPSYEEIPIACEMDEAVETEYRRIEHKLVQVLRTDRRVAKKILSAYLNLLTIYADQPYDQRPIFYPDSDVPIVEPENIGDADTLGEKEQKTLEIVKAALQNGERALIYTSWVRTDSQQKLKKLLTDEGYRTEILTDKIKTTNREEWVQKKLAAGMQVLIVNPSLVETGLDLNAFTTLVFYSMGYKLFTLRQASRRSWRINQKASAVKVYMLYYEDTMQQKCLKLMASKLAVAGLIEGNFSEEGLAAMSDVQDMTSQMAKELMLGIRDNVEDIAAAFRKMAFENPGREAAEVHAEEMSLPLKPAPERIELPKRVLTAEQEEKLQAAMVQLEQQKAKRTKKTQQVENQLSLFDFVA